VGELKPGQLVCSRAGRDKGNYYFVLEGLDDKHVWVVDGKNKTLASPKKKNIIHLQKHNYISSDFVEKKLVGQLVDSLIVNYMKEALKDEELEEGG